MNWTEVLWTVLRGMVVYWSTENRTEWQGDLLKYCEQYWEAWWSAEVLWTVLRGLVVCWSTENRTEWQGDLLKYCEQYWVAWWSNEVLWTVLSGRVVCWSTVNSTERQGGWYGQTIIKKRDERFLQWCCWRFTLPRSYAESLGKQFVTFWRDFDPLEHCKMLNQWHSITSSVM